MDGKDRKISREDDGCRLDMCAVKWVPSSPKQPPNWVHIQTGRPLTTI